MNSRLISCDVIYDDSRRLACICHAIESARDMKCIVHAKIAGVCLVVTGSSTAATLLEELKAKLKEKEQ